jgi:hypothetical protein
LDLPEIILSNQSLQKKFAFANAVCWQPEQSETAFPFLSPKGSSSGKRIISKLDGFFSKKYESLSQHQILPQTE